MLNYMRAELYKLIHRPYPYWFLATLMGLVLLLVGGAAIANVQTDFLHIDFTALLMIAMPFLSVGLYLAFLVGDMVFSEQYKHGTLKNEVSFGISRTRVYLGKLLTEILVGLVLVLAVVAFCLLLGAILLPKDPDTAQMLHYFLATLMGALPLYVGALGLAHLCYTLFKSSTAAAMLPIFSMLFLSPILGNLSAYELGFPTSVARVLYPLLLTAPFDSLTGDTAWIVSCWLVGLGWLVATTAIGLTLFRKREIN